MSEVEERLRDRATDDLQKAIAQGTLIPEAAALAAQILQERGATVPAARPEGELEAEQKEASHRSNRTAAAVVLTIITWAVYAYTRGLFDEGGARLENSVFILGLVIAAEIGLLKLR